MCPALTEHYHKARKPYGLSSGLLLLWAVVGIELEPTPLENLKIKLLSPEAVPVILFFLVLYFGLRFTIEWSQCDSYRRKFRATQIDFYTAHLLGLVSVSIYAIQRASTIRFSEYFAQSPSASAIPMILLSFLLGFIITRQTFLSSGNFRPSSGNQPKYTLALNTSKVRIQFTAWCFMVIPAIVLIFLTWLGGKFPIIMILAIAFVLSSAAGVIWVLFSHTRYRLDKVPPAPPENLKVS